MKRRRRRIVDLISNLSVSYSLDNSLLPLRSYSLLGGDRQRSPEIARSVRACPDETRDVCGDWSGRARHLRVNRDRRSGRLRLSARTVRAGRAEAKHSGRRVGRARGRAARSPGPGAERIVRRARPGGPFRGDALPRDRPGRGRWYIYGKSA